MYQLGLNTSRYEISILYSDFICFAMFSYSNIYYISISY